jgi:WD40 repeat protein
MRVRKAICTSGACASVLTVNTSPLGRRTSRFECVTLAYYPVDINSEDQIWDIATKRIRMVFDAHEQEVYSLEFSRNGRLIVSGSGDKTVRIWDMGIDHQNLEAG